MTTNVHASWEPADLSPIKEAGARRPETVVVRVTGRLDLVRAPEVKNRFIEVTKQGARNVVVDLGEVSFIDSSGLGALISGLKTVRQAGGDLRIARPGDQARMVLQLTTLDRVLHPYASVEEALEHF